MDILFQAYQRAAEIGRVKPLSIEDYAALFTVAVPDISRTDNEALARSARDLAQGLQTLQAQIPGHSPTLRRLALKLFMKFAGEPLPEETLIKILQESSSPDQSH